MKRIVAFYKNGDRYLKEMGSGKSSLYFFSYLYYIVCGNVLFSSSDFGHHFYSSSYLSQILCLASDIFTIVIKNLLNFPEYLKSMEQNPY